jgi:hypothetical protein
VRTGEGAVAEGGTVTEGGVDWGGRAEGAGDGVRAVPQAAKASARTGSRTIRRRLIMTSHTQSSVGPGPSGLPSW